MRDLLSKLEGEMQRKGRGGLDMAPYSMYAPYGTDFVSPWYLIHSHRHCEGW
jgi:hypothetical protein